MKFFFELLVGTAAVCIGIAPTAAHTVGETQRSAVPPPLMVEMQETEKLARELAGDAPRARGVINTLKLWPVGRKLSACFFDGDNRWKAFFVEVSKIWTSGTSLVIDFGSAPGYSGCDKKKPSDIRISFARSGAWSYIGTDSRRYDLDGPSLNIDYPQGKPWEAFDKREFAHLIFHELGHALGLEHEHQSPEAKCDAEFNWPKVYNYMETKQGWSKQEIDFNMRTLISAPRLRTSSYDKTSIMHYYFPPWMFARGTTSSCYVGQNLEPSPTDIEMVREAYPSQTALQDAHLQERADASSAELARLKLTAPQLSRVGLELQAVLARFERPVSLEFDLTSEARSRGPNQGFLKECSGTATHSHANAACQIAPDASQLVISAGLN